jgi:ADP-ribose pyrophosphatase YjhB (NUDIX family)
MQSFPPLISLSGSVTGGHFIAKRIAPYKNTWALPGLRKMKPKGIEDMFARIARNEIGITIDSTNRRFIGQYVGRFKTEQNWQDLSTCYAVFSDAQIPAINHEHFSGHCFIKAKEDIPAKTRAMYTSFLNLFFTQMYFNLTN